MPRFSSRCAAGNVARRDRAAFRRLAMRHGLRGRCSGRRFSTSSTQLQSGVHMDRRTFNTALLSAATTSAIEYGSAAAANARTVLYQSLGDRLIQWDVDVD